MRGYILAARGEMYHGCHSLLVAMRQRGDIWQKESRQHIREDIDILGILAMIHSVRDEVQNRESEDVI